MSAVIDIGELARRLNADIEALAFHLFPAGRAEGPEFKIGSVAGEPGRSMSIRIKGAKRGVWRDFASGETGDALDLVAAAIFRGEKRPAIEWARQWLGLEGASAGGAVSARRPAAPPTPASSSEEAEREREFARKRALAIYLEAKAEIKGTPVDWYLKGRGIDLARLGRQPRALRFHPHLRYRETEQYFPAMVALISDGEGEAISIHRTYLTERASAPGAPRIFLKANVPMPKMTLGSYRGGAIRLWRGMVDGKPRPPLRDVTAGETVVLTEGIENGLTVALAYPELRILAGISVSNLANVELPSQVTTVVLFADNDEGAQAQAGLEKAIAAHAQAGRTVKVARAPAEHKDANDWARALQQGGHAA